MRRPGRTRYARRRAVAAAAFVILLGVVNPPPSAAGDPPAGLSAAIAERAAFGLPADSQLVQSLLGSQADVGSAQIGIVATADEVAMLDIPARAAFQEEMITTVMPIAQAEPTFAGAYFDEASGGAFVIRSQNPTEMEKQLEPSVAAFGGLVRFEFATTTDEQLATAANAAASVGMSEAGGINVREARVDLATGRLDITIGPGSDASLAATTLTRLLGVPVAATVGDYDRELACTDRDNCAGPVIKDGVRIRKGWSTSPFLCTLGFQVRAAGNAQLLTAGHCPYAKSGTDWWHNGYSGISPLGNEISGTDLLYSGWDSVRIELPDAIASAKIYGSARSVKSERYPVQGEYICASLGFTDFVDCGSVSNSYTTWTSSTCNCVENGASYSGIYSTGGDSGSPVYATGSTLDSAIAVGILATGGGSGGTGNFTRTHDIVSLQSLTFITG